MKATIPCSEKPYATATAAVQFNRVHLPRMTRLALAGFVGAADKRLGVKTMPDFAPYAPLIALAGSLAVALIGLYQWRRQHSKANRSGVAETRRKAIESIWLQLEEINIRLRPFEEDRRKIDVREDIRSVNETYLRNSLYLPDELQGQIRDYIQQLHIVASTIYEYQEDQEEWKTTMAFSPRREAKSKELYGRTNLALVRLTKQRAALKVELLAHIDA